jgi:hypothetical protein
MVDIFSFVLYDMMNVLTFLCYGDVSFVGQEDGGQD